MVGAEGNDELEDTSGDDFLRGAAGDDIIVVGDGNDTIYGDEDGDTITSTGGAGTVIYGGAGNDVIRGAAGEDLFGNLLDDEIYCNAGDTAIGGRGGDNFYIGVDEAFAAPDKIDGGDEIDEVIIGSLTGAVVLTTQILQVESISTSGGDITVTDAVIGGSTAMTVYGGSAEAFLFDASAEVNGKYIVHGTGFDDVILGGGGADELYAGDGTDVLRGGGGNDSFHFLFETPSGLEPGDNVDGGAGKDTLFLSGPYDGAEALVLGPNTVINVETLVLISGNVTPGDPFIYELTLDDGNVAAGRTLTIDTTALRPNGPATVDGSAERDGKLEFISDISGDTFIGGRGRDVFTGGGESDVMTGEGGADKFIYLDVGDSTGANFDTLIGFNANKDKIALEFPVRAVDPAVTGGALSKGTFDADLAAAIDGADLLVDHAVLFTPTAGNLSGRLFLVVDANDVAGYQGGGVDIAIELSAAANLNNLAGAFLEI
jgi:Ca2+-binding RTX toxin-like protein